MEWMVWGGEWEETSWPSVRPIKEVPPTANQGFPTLSGRVLPVGEEPPPPPVAPEPLLELLLEPPLPSGGGAPAPFHDPPLAPPVPPLPEPLGPAPLPLLVDGHPPPVEQSTWATASAAPP
jgi:hypothetical protein